jgi:integrase
VASTAQVNALAEAVAPRFRACILLAAYYSLRRGELLGLQRGDLDLLHGTPWVRRTVVSLRGGTLLVGAP